MSATNVRVVENRDPNGERREPYWLVQLRTDETSPWITTAKSCNNRIAACGRATVLAKRSAPPEDLGMVSG
jgi:hypothetical protein